jgi:streptomycin 6-kinase
MPQLFSPLIDHSNHTLPEEYMRRARLYLEELCEMKGEVHLAHGDLHHGNIVQHEDGWLSIDPKGVFGPVGFDVGCFLRNPLEQLVVHPQRISIVGRRLDHCASRLKIDRSFLVKLGYCQAVLAACWALSDNQPQWKNFLECARLIVS